jgi:6-phosphogluconolactonase
MDHMTNKPTRRGILASTLLAPSAAVLTSLVGCQESGSSAGNPASSWAFIGTYTRGGSKGIYRIAYDAQTGKMEAPELAAETPGPSFLAIHPSGNFLYAVNELSEFRGEPGGSVTAFKLDKATGTLTEINAVSSKGGGPCHLMVSPSGKAVVIANYGAGSTVSFRIGDDGALSEAACVIQHSGSGPNDRRQKGPHSHGVAMSSVAGQQLVHVADLGIDQILHYRLDDEGVLHPWETQASVSVARGAGPRHVIVHPNGRLAFVINELDSTMTSFTISREDGAWTLAGTAPTLPEGFSGESTTAELALHPNGRVLYGSNRGHDSICVFQLEGDDGKLVPVGHVSTEGKTPRCFAVHPEGKILIAANQGSGNLTAFLLQADKGMPTYTGHEVAVDMPVCVVFV